MHVLGRPFNCTAGLVALTTGGVFERHPNLRVAFFECSAEWILYWMHRMDDDYKRMKNGFTPKITKKPSEYLKKNCYVTCEADERLLPLALEEFNEDRVLLASDYPHFDSEYPGTVHELQERSDISDKQNRRSFARTPRSFCGYSSPRNSAGSTERLFQPYCRIPHAYLPHSVVSQFRASRRYAIVRSKLARQMRAKRESRSMSKHYAVCAALVLSVLAPLLQEPRRPSHREIVGDDVYTNCEYRVAAQFPSEPKFRDITYRDGTRTAPARQF